MRLEETVRDLDAHIAHSRADYKVFLDPIARTRSNYLAPVFHVEQLKFGSRHVHASLIIAPPFRLKAAPRHRLK
ncbi:MAG TPA: hypothetical protein DIT28_02980 [Oxalobacteraceae bacterium]|nr:hypothetical protein [Oxalobacteraceae bacterium]